MPSILALSTEESTHKEMTPANEKIFAAATQITEDGEYPTLAAIQEITGGSYSTISLALDEWRGRQRESGVPRSEQLPEAIIGKSLELWVACWEHTLALIDSHSATEKEALEKANADMRTALEEAARLADKFADEVKRRRSHLTSAEAAERAAQNEVDALRGEAATSQERARAAASHTTEIELRAAELGAALERAHQEAGQTKNELTEQQSARQEAVADRDRARAELTAMRAEAEASARASEERLQRAEAERKQLIERLAIAEAERDEARKEAAELTGRVQALQEQTVAPPEHPTPAAKARASAVAPVRKTRSQHSKTPPIDRGSAR